MKKFIATPAALVLLLAPAPLPAQAAAELAPETSDFVAIAGPTVVLTGVKVIDGTGAGARSNQTVVIEGNRITAAGPAGTVDVPAGADVRDLSGHTVIPGMIGLHNHMFFMGAGGRMSQGMISSPRLYLASGVTTIRTTGSVSPYADLNVKSNIERGLAPGPRMHVTAPYVTGPNPALGDMAQVTTPEEARRFVRYWAGEGVSWIKAYTTIRRAELAAVVEEAHAQGFGSRDTSARSPSRRPSTSGWTTSSTALGPRRTSTRASGPTSARRTRWSWSASRGTRPGKRREPSSSRWSRTGWG